MLHKNMPSTIVSRIPAAGESTRLHLAAPLVTGDALVNEVPGLSAQLLDLIAISTRRCSAFFAEAAVLVLVFGILDYFMLRGRIELAWIVGAIGISVGLLVASIAMDFTAQRWIKAHP